MTNSEFTRLLRTTARAANKYKRLLDKATEEYVARYGVLPGDVDDDYWIDCLELGCGEADEEITARQVHDSAKLRK